MKKILLGIILVIGFQFIYSYYSTMKDKNIVLDIIDRSNCVVHGVSKEDTLMYSRDGKHVYFLKASLTCEDGGNLIAEIQYVKDRERKNQGLKIYWQDGSQYKTGVWYHP